MTREATDCGSLTEMSKKIGLAVLAAAFSLLFFAPALHAENGTPLPPIDVVLLIDVSGSMRFTDPNRAALSAAADLIDMLTLGESRAGVVGFSGRIQYLMPLRLIETEYDRLEMREQIAAFQYVGYTDIGAALLVAAEMLHEAGNLQNPMILFMSDGYIEISRHAARTAAESYADVEAALDLLERTVPIYTIGMHNPGGVDVRLLTMISERSNAHTLFTYDANELPEMVVSILEAHAARIPVPEPVEHESEPEPEEIPAPVEDYEPEPEIEYRSGYEAENEEASPYEEQATKSDKSEESAEPTENEVSPSGYVIASFAGLAALISMILLVRTVLK